MTTIVYEGIVERGKIRLQTDVRLPERTKVLVIVPDRKSHPAMAAYGLWKDDPEMKTLAREVREDRDKYISRPEADL